MACRYQKHLIWHNEKDRLKIQLDEMDKLDKEFYEQADILLGFTDNAYEYFSKGNIKQKRKILEIISEEITYYNLTDKFERRNVEII